MPHRVSGESPSFVKTQVDCLTPQFAAKELRSLEYKSFDFLPTYTMWSQYILLQSLKIPRYFTGLLETTAMLLKLIKYPDKRLPLRAYDLFLACRKLRLLSTAKLVSPSNNVSLMTQMFVPATMIRGQLHIILGKLMFFFPHRKGSGNDSHQNIIYIYRISFHFVLSLFAKRKLK